MSTPPAIDTRRPFRRLDGLRAGLTKHVLDGPRFHPLFGSVRVATDRPLDTETKARAALIVSAPGAVVSHHTAAQLYGGVVPHDPDVHVTVSDSADRPRHRGIRAHVAAGDLAVRLPRNVRATTPERTFLDLGRELDLVDLVVLGDSMVGSRWTTPERLVAAAAAAQGAGSRRARMAASLVRRRVDSPMETRLRLLIVLAGLPEPEVNVEIRAVDGRLLYRIDLSYPQFRLGIEYDGRHHAENDAQWAGDITRREALDGLAWRLVVVRSPGVYLDPGQTIDRIVAVMTQVGMPLPAGAPHEGWRRHFPGPS